MVTVQYRHKTKTILGMALVCLLGMAVGCHRPPSAQETADYVKGIEELRRTKDKIFREDSSSPIPAAARSGFGGLTYYPVDSQLRLEVTAKPYDKQETIEMATSKGEIQPYIRYAYADFTIGSQPVRLTIYATQMKDRLHFFVPFKDKTNGTETYPAGRYLELDSIDRRWKTVLDFNQAINPYCAYNHDYSCPIPPAENHLKVAIRAGERYVEPKS